jgi:hypothetical protein
VASDDAIQSRVIPLLVTLMICDGHMTTYIEPRTTTILLWVRGHGHPPGPSAIPGEPHRPASRAGDLSRNCQRAVVPNTLEEPGRRIGQRGDATRAPTRVPRPGWAAGCRPSASRDWPQSDKSINSLSTATGSPPPIRTRDASSDRGRIQTPPYAGSLLETGLSADRPLRRSIRPKSRRGWNASFRTPT